MNIPDRGMYSPPSPWYNNNVVLFIPKWRKEERGMQQFEAYNNDISCLLQSQGYEKLGYNKNTVMCTN